jgi:hypothetical protein
VAGLRRFWNTYMTDSRTITPFSPDYVSQITPFKERTLKRPDLTTIPNVSINSGSTDDAKAKQLKIRKASI